MEPKTKKPTSASSAEDQFNHWNLAIAFLLAAWLGVGLIIVEIFGGQSGKVSTQKINVGVSKNRGTPKWMVYNGKPPLKWMLWRYPNFRKHPCHFHSTCWKVSFDGSVSLQHLILTYPIPFRTWQLGDCHDMTRFWADSIWRGGPDIATRPKDWFGPLKMSDRLVTWLFKRNFKQKL